MTKNKTFRVYLFTRSKHTAEEALSTPFPRPCKLRVEAIHGKTRRFATLPVTFYGDMFPRLFNSDGTLKAKVKKPLLSDEVASRQTALAYSTACSLVEKLIKQDRFTTITSLQFDQELNEAFRKVKGHDENYWWDKVKAERDSK